MNVPLRENCSINVVLVNYLMPHWMDTRQQSLHTVKQEVARPTRNVCALCSISGVEERLARDTYVSDETEGIIPRAVRYLW